MGGIVGGHRLTPGTCWLLLLLRVRRWIEQVGGLLSFVLNRQRNLFVHADANPGVLLRGIRIRLHQQLLLLELESGGRA